MKRPFLIATLAAIAVAGALKAEAAQEALYQEDIEAILEQKGVERVEEQNLPAELKKDQEAKPKIAVPPVLDSPAATATKPIDLERELKGLADKIKIGATKAKNRMAEEHRSRVANFIQNILKTSFTAPGTVGEQVREIARQQSDNEQALVENLDRIKNRNKFLRFLIGVDQKAANDARNRIAQVKEQLESLKSLKNKFTAEPERVDLENQLEKFQAEIERIAGELKNEESKFSLWGWFKGLLKINKVSGN